MFANGFSGLGGGTLRWDCGARAGSVHAVRCAWCWEGGGAAASASAGRGGGGAGGGLGAGGSVPAPKAVEKLYAKSTSGGGRGGSAVKPQDLSRDLRGFEGGHINKSLLTLSTVVQVRGAPEKRRASLPCKGRLPD